MPELLIYRSLLPTWLCETCQHHQATIVLEIHEARLALCTACAEESAETMLERARSSLRLAPS